MSENASTDRPKHLPSLDGLRGIAVLMVLGLHFGGGAQSNNLVVRSIGLLFKGGGYGVTLFFILSGFLITGILWDTRGSAHWWRNFYIRRILRIFPLYYGTLFVAFLASVFSHTALDCLSRIWIHVFFLQDIPPLLQRASDIGGLWLFHFWSLAIEEQFYLVWPFLLIQMKNTRQARNLCIGVFLFSALYRAVVWLVAADPVGWNSFLFLLVGELAAGSFLAICYRDPLWTRVKSQARFVTWIALAGYLAVSVITRNLSPLSGLGVNVGLPCATIFGSGVLVLSLQKGLINRFTCLPVLRWFGDISYGLYVIHELLNPVFRNLAVAILPHASHNAQSTLFLFLGITLSIILAWLSRRFYEEPFLRLRARFKSQPVAVGAYLPKHPVVSET